MEILKPLSASGNFRTARSLRYTILYNILWHDVTHEG